MLGAFLTRKYIYVFLLIILFSRSTYSRNWIVYPDGTGDAPTIQAAIHSAGAGDTISVMPGVYEQPTIYCRKDSLTIIGVEGAAHTILQNSTFPPGILEIGQYYHFNNLVIVKGFTFRNSVWWAVYVARCKYVTVENCIFYNNELYALIYELAPYSSIFNNLFYGGVGGIKNVS